MYLMSTKGKILYEGRFPSIRKGVEMAIEDHCILDDINLRKANLAGAHMDGARMKNACFWGANLGNANMAEGDFTGADFRTANCLDTCFAESNCHNANFSGTYFSRTIFRSADLSSTRFSCPSIFSIDLYDVKTLEGAIYSHLGEVDCDLSHAPLIIRGLQKPLIFMDDSVLIGTDLQKITARETIIKNLTHQFSKQKLLQFEGVK